MIVLRIIVGIAAICVYGSVVMILINAIKDKKGGTK